ncbi:uncharacterized protein LOC102722484 isoform X2 [Oryza brachyantha]|uniref:uncharacterized protein LOC102722484 isoform X2 n=1 Tax=Oryza brachyantha TaxID=4533 RepID=UPI0003EAB15F|nr:uncharacterized protein LOC102722484 isoform X2 [Oryza brachyantha]
MCMFDVFLEGQHLATVYSTFGLINGVILWDILCDKKAMINLFDLSTGMASTDVLMGRTRRDGSQVRKGRQDVNRAFGPTIGCVEDKLVASTRSSSSNRSNVSEIKRLVATDISKEVESKRKPPSVVARLMGLDDDPPAKEPTLHSSRTNLRKSHSLDNLAATNIRWQQQELRHYSSTAPNVHISPKETVEFKDVYEVSEDPSRRHHILGQTFPRERSSGNKSDIKIEVVRQKFMEAKRLATDENLLHSKQFQEALEVLSSNRELFLKFLEEPNPVFLKQLNGLETMSAPPPTKRITVLKPIKSVENNGVRETRTHRVNEENEPVIRKTHQRSYSAEDNFSKSTRIVVLKPSPGKPNRTGARLYPGAAPSEKTRRPDFHGGLQDDSSIVGSTELLHGPVQHLPESHHRRDESLISSTYSNGYGGDESSFSGSEVDYIDEGCSPSDSEVVSPMSQHSWDYIKRHNTPYSASTFSRAPHSHSPESSVIREAKKRLSERWATVAYNEINQEQVPLPRSSTTLGEMLSLQAAKKEAVAGVVSVSSNRSSGTENESAMQDACESSLREYGENGKSSPRNLAKSRSVPVSSSIFDDRAVNAQSANSEEISKVVTKSGRAKLSFKGKISSFFFSGNKRPTKEKTSLSSDNSGERVGCIGYMTPQSVHNLGPDEQIAFCKDKTDNSTSQAPCSSKDAGLVEVPVSSDYAIGDVNEVKSNGDLKSIPDEPSPTSILDTVFEDSNSNEPESSSCTERVAVQSPAIESFARSLSWEDTNSCSSLLGCLKHSNDDYDELQCYSLVQEIVSSAGLGHLQLSIVFTGWYLPDSPIDPALCDKFLDRKEENAKSRERRSNQKLIFDSVSTALVEIGQDALLCTYPWSRECLGTWREKLSRTLGEEVWNIVSDWLYGDGSFVANMEDDAGTTLERIMQEEVEGKGWIKLLTMDTDEITEQIACEVLDDLVTDTVEHQAICLSEHGISMPVPMVMPN